MHIAIIAIVAISILAGVVVTNLAIKPLGTGPRSSCPEQDPVARITWEEAKAVVAASYNVPSAWSFLEDRIVKFCEQNHQWWANTEEGWRLVPAGQIPEDARLYEERVRRDLIFYVVEANHRGPALTIDEGWVDAVSSQLIARITIAN